MNKRKLLGQRIRQSRESNGLTQERLALMVGINRGYLSGIERGKRNVAIDNLVKISEGLNTPLETLFRGM